MNENNDNKYQDQFQVPTGANISSGSEGYNDTYYDQSYNDNKYNEYEEPKKSFPWKLVIIIILALLFIFLFWYFLFGRSSTSNSNVQYEKLSDELCEKAKTYVDKKEGYIDTSTPGATAYVSLQDLVDDYSIPSEPIRDPRYKKSLFKKSEGNEYLSFNSYLRLFVMANGQVSCEGLVDTGDDHTKPILTLKGTSPVKISKGTNFQDPGAKAVDDVDGDITDKITRSGNVDTLVVGEYKITYSVSDTSGNTTTIDRIIKVEEYAEIEVTLGSGIDLITPQIELKGTNPYCIVVGQKYKEPGAIATDNIDGNITNRIKVDSSDVTGERTGNFRVTYEVSDTFGHRAIAYRSVMVRTSCPDPTSAEAPVNTRPQIQLIGGTSVTINMNEEYQDRGATAWDKEDGALPVVLISNTVNTSRAGIYEVVYKATDSQGLSSTAKRIVTVKDPNAVSNTATFLEVPQHLRIPLGNVQTIPVPQARDSYGNAIQVTSTIKDSSEAVVQEINFYRVETYRIEYFAKPANGVGQTVHRNVTIYDDVPPTLNIADKIYLPIRTSNCDLTIVDLKAYGMTVSDAPNEVAPEVILSGGKNSMCTLNSNGIEIEIYAKDASGNKSPVKKVKLYVINGEGTQEPTSVEIGNCGTNGELSIFVGGEASLEAQVYPSNSTDIRVTWKSALPQYVTIDENGNIKGIAKGSSKVTVTTVKGGKTDTCNIIVKEKNENIPATGVDIAGCESGTMTMTLGSTKTLSAVVKPTNATNKSVDWDFGEINPILSVLIPKCASTSGDVDLNQVKAQCAQAKSDNNTTLYAECFTIYSSKCIGGSPIIIADKLGQHTIKVTTKDGKITKSCVVKVVEKTTDTTPPSKVIVTANTANTADPYNKLGLWYGGTLGRKITITVQSTDPETKITKFIAGRVTTVQALCANSVPSLGPVYEELQPMCIGGGTATAVDKMFTITPEVGNPNVGKLVIDKDFGDEIAFMAVNEAGLISEASDVVIVKLDNSGPKTTFTSWIEDPNKWVSKSEISVKYESVDKQNYDTTAKGSLSSYLTGSGVKEYQYTHDDVKAKAAKDIKIEGTTNNITMVFQESNLNKYVYVRAVDNLGNIGPWTEKPSYLNMDTVPPAPTTLSFLENTNNTQNVKILFKFTDNKSPKMSGFGKYEYTLNAGSPSTKTTETEPLLLTTPGSYTLSAWSIDKAGNKSASPGTLGGIVVAKAPETPTPPKPKCKYRYIITNNYTGVNSYSLYTYDTPDAAKTGCQNTDKYNTTVPKGACTTTSTTTSKTSYKYKGYDKHDPKKQYITGAKVFATSKDAVAECSAAGLLGCTGVATTTSTTKYAYIFTEVFTNKKTTGEFKHTSELYALNECKGNHSSALNTKVSVVTCTGDPKPDPNLKCQ